MGRQYFNGIWHTGFLNLNTGAVETNSSYPNSIYSDLIFFPAGTYTIEGATITEWRLRVYNSDGTYRESISCNSAAVTLKTNIYARILLFNGLNNEQQQTFKIYRGGDEMVKASAQYTIAEIHEECNVVISNESHVFRADKNNTAIANNVTIQVYGYQGNTQVATTVGTISGKPSAGMTTTINNNGQTNTSITVAVTTALTSSIANNGVLTIPITVAGKTFNKTFSWSKAQTGATGATGDTGAAARTYWVTSSANTITRSMKGILTPTTITFSSYYRDGTSATSTAYSGRFIIQESTNGTTWTTKYTSSANESSKIYTPTATTNLVRCAMYAAGGTTNKLDELTIGIIDSIDDLEIGGRNYILEGRGNKLAGYFTNFNSIINEDYAEFNITLENSGYNSIRLPGFVLDCRDYEVGAQVVYSYDIMITKWDFDEGAKLGEYWMGQRYTGPVGDINDGAYRGVTKHNLPKVGVDCELNEWIHVSKVLTIPNQAGEGIGSQGLIQIQNTTADTSISITLCIKNVKLEYGNKQTDWSPAPEDINNRIDNVEKSVSEIVVGTQTKATNEWTGVVSFSELIDGQQISYWLPYAGKSESATLELTLADGSTTGPKNLYYQGTSRINTHYPAGSVVHLTYRENVSIAGSTDKYTGWWGDANYNTDTTDRLKWISAIKAVVAISSGRLIAGTVNGFQHIATNVAFDINKPILYTGSAITAASTGTNNFLAYPNVNLSSTKSGFTGTNGKTCYLVGTLNGTTFTPNSTVFTTTEPTSDNGLVYISLGLMRSTTNINLYPEHPLYKFVNGKFQSLSQVAFEAQDNLDNLEIGGRNLALETGSNYEHVSGFNSKTNTIAGVDDYILIDEIYETTRVARWSGSSTNSYTGPYFNVVTRLKATLELESIYTISAWMKADKATSLSNFLENQTTLSKQYNIGTEWTRVWQTFKCKKVDSNFTFYTYPNATAELPYIYMCGIKLEKGNKATDWSPAPEDQNNYIDAATQNTSDTLKTYIDGQNKVISDSIDDKIADYDVTIKNHYDVKFDNTATKQEVDTATGKIRDLEEYTSQLKVDGDALRFNVEKTKGVNLIKNSVMLQYKTNTNGKISANFWLNKNLKEENFTNVTCNDIDSVRAKTTSGSAIVFDYSTDATGLTYDYILSSPIDFKINSSNIMCSYKIKGAITAGTFFAGLVFYKRDTTESGLGATTAFAQASGIPTAHYLALNEYTTTDNFADFTEDYVLRTTPFVKQNKQTVTWSCPVSAENTITLPYPPYLTNGSCAIMIYNVDGSTKTVTTASTTVNLGEGDWPKAVTISYDRLIANFEGTTKTSIAKTDFDKVLVNEVLMYYNTSDKQIWVYNPFTGAYVKGTNNYTKYNDTDYSEVDSVRVILGVRGASTSAKFKGYLELSDLKVEFDSLSTIWTQHPGETYAKNYVMDERGFTISSNTNMMFIDEDEIAAYVLNAEGKPEKENPVFQITGEDTILKKTIIKEELLIENNTQSKNDGFAMKQEEINNQWYFLFY